MDVYIHLQAHLNMFIYSTMNTAVCVNTYPHTDMSIHARNIHASTYECPPNTVICSFMYLHSTLIYSVNGYTTSNIYTYTKITTILKAKDKPTQTHLCIYAHMYIYVYMHIHGCTSHVHTSLFTTIYMCVRA